MKYIQCPTTYNPYTNEDRSVFLAGGISGCENWQDKLAALLNFSSLVVINPRRVDFDINNLELTEKQISWEYNHLRLTHTVSFWFTKDTVQPITLFELGTVLGGNQRILVGCDPNYCRISDVKTQLKLRRPDIQIVDNLQDLAKQIMAE